MTLCRSGGHSTGMTRDSEVGRQVLCPSTKFLCTDPLTVVLRVTKNAEHSCGKETRHRLSHTRESLHEEDGWLLAEQLK